MIPSSLARGRASTLAWFGALALGALSCGEPNWSEPPPTRSADAAVDTGPAGDESGKVERDAGDGSVPGKQSAPDASLTNVPLADSGRLPPQADPTPDCTLTPSACQSPCTGSSCTSACANGARRCGQGNLVEKCDDKGAWKSDKTCPFLCSGDGECSGECKPGTKECTLAAAGVSPAARWCGDDAVWEKPTLCSDKTCVKGACVGECEVGRTRCDAIGAGQTCDANGKWVAGSAVPCKAVVNLALHAVVEASSAIDYATWSKAGLTDGLSDTGYSTLERTTPGGGNVDGCADWVSVTMAANATFSKVVLVPRTDAGAVGAGFPRAFKIELWNGSSWAFRVNARPAEVRPQTPQVYTWGQSDLAKTVRVCATELGVDDNGRYLMQFSELMILE